MFWSSTINSLQANSSATISAQFNNIFNPNPTLNIEGNAFVGSTINFSITDSTFKHKDIYVVISGLSETNYSNNIAHKIIDFHPVNYMIGLSLGISQGMNLGDGRVIPLNRDEILLASLNQSYWSSLGISNFQGNLNSQGQAKGFMIIPNITGISGLTFYTSFITSNATSIYSISPARNITIQ